MKKQGMGFMVEITIIPFLKIIKIFSTCPLKYLSTGTPVLTINLNKLTTHVDSKYKSQHKLPPNTYCMPWDALSFGAVGHQFPWACYWAMKL
jgi:hypothetical protein